MSSKKERTCLVCGCTDRHACSGGCSWFSESVDICTKCLTPLEATLLFELLENIAAVKNDLDRAEGQLVLYTRILKERKA